MTPGNCHERTRGEGRCRQYSQASILRLQEKVPVETRSKDGAGVGGSVPVVFAMPEKLSQES